MASDARGGRPRSRPASATRRADVSPSRKGGGEGAASAVFAAQLGLHITEFKQKALAAHTSALQELQATSLALRAENEALRSQLTAFQADSGSNNNVTVISNNELPGTVPPWDELPVTMSPSSGPRGGRPLSPIKPRSVTPLGSKNMTPSMVAAAAAAAAAALEEDEEDDSLAEIWPVWQRIDSSSNHDVAPERASASDKVSVDLKDSVLQTCSFRELEESPRGSMKGFVLYPNSIPVIVWMTFGGILLLYDAIMIPLTSSLPVPGRDVYRGIEIPITLYWALDVVRNFVTGYENNSIAGLEMRHWQIFLNYGKSWMLMDVALVILDIALALASDADPENGSVPIDGGASRTSRAARIWRIVRIARLARVVKLARKVWKSANNRMAMRHMLMLKAFYVFLAVIFVCHFMGCYFCGLENLSYSWTSSTSNWKTGKGLQNADLGELYVIALNWAIAQSGFSSTDVQPTNVAEHLYAALCGFVWMVIVSITIGLFTLWLREAREHERKHVKECHVLRRFLEQHEVSRNVSAKVLRFFRTNYRPIDSRVQESDIKFLQSLPLQLQIRLHREVYANTLRQHPFFSLLGTEDETALTAVCHLAVRDCRYGTGEVVFQEDDESRQMFCVINGELDYFQRKAGASTVRLQHGEWICEPALWRKWAHRGRLVACVPSELVSVDVRKVHAIIDEILSLGNQLPGVRKYARRAAAYFSMAGPQATVRLDTDALVHKNAKPSPAAINAALGSDGQVGGARGRYLCKEDATTPTMVRSTLCQIGDMAWAPAPAPTIKRSLSARLGAHS